MRLEPLPSAEEGALLLGRELPRSDEPLHFEWVPSDLVRPLPGPMEPRGCRYTVGPHKRQCGASSCAVIYRGERGRPWHYCEDHLFGRAISNGQVFDLHVLEGASITELRP